MLPRLHRLRSRRGRVEQGKRDQVVGVFLGEGLVRVSVATTEEIDRGIARGGEKEGLGVEQARWVLDLQYANVGFLNEVVVIGQRGKTFGKIRAQGWLVGLHVLVKPSFLFDR